MTFSRIWCQGGGPRRLGTVLLTGDPATIVTAVRDGVREVTTATVHFSFALAETLLGA